MAMENNIKLFRAKLGYTQEDLAKKANVTRQTIIALEKGSYTPSLELAFKLSDLFQVPIEEIFYRTEDTK
ncbi:helix-turn-helix transcriptional regulator [Proteiniclasticum ruminis]|uniref:Putative transcriptional regulator n=1 Tax=Proteiniclasticum ruminis TaxID=398199 RepID=A0A1I5BBV9_9CLOT|nr:helix-turn-helix transcriptional regulator [Proteiniclasticum ruminis]SFN72192.1 putative transcriptional regulator [Proteiniclasticum ruminis]